MQDPGLAKTGIFRRDWLPTSAALLIMHIQVLHDTRTKKVRGRRDEDVDCRRICMILSDKSTYDSEVCGANAMQIVS